MARFEIHQKDPNQDDIVKALREAGATVEIIGRPVDLLVGIGGVAGAAEVKLPKAKLRPSQVKFFGRFKGAKAVLRTESEAVEFVQFLRSIARVGVTIDKTGDFVFGGMTSSDIASTKEESDE